MSTFRPPQVPQQPRTFFPFGQPLGIPIPRTDYQLQQSAAYWRDRPQSEALEQALGIVDVSTPSPAIAAFVPCGNQPPVIAPPRASLEALEQALQITHLGVTPGQPLGTPVPRTEHQMAAYFPPRPIAIEILSEQLETGFTLGLALGAPKPQQSDQAAAYRRERPSLEALEQATQLTDPQVTSGTLLGTPNPVQTDQTAALWRARQEIAQPPLYLIPAASPVFVPAVLLPVPTAVIWRFEWLIESLQPNVTVAQPLGTPLPQPSDQSAAYRRDRAATEALQQALVRSAQPPPVASFVPAPAVQMIASNLWRFEWLVELMAPNVTAGQPLGIPPPRQTDQAVSYWRIRAEFPATSAFVPQTAAPVGYVPPLALQIPIAAPTRFEALEMALQSPAVRAQQAPFVPANALPLPSAGAQRFEALKAVLPNRTPMQAPAFVPATTLPIWTSVSWRYEWLINSLQPRSSRSPGITNFVPAQATPIPLRNAYVAALQPPVGVAALLGQVSLIGSLRYLIRRLRARRFTLSLIGSDFTVRRGKARRFTVSNADYLAFEPLYAGEKIPLTFDFTPDLASDELPPGVLLSGTPTVTVTLLSGADATPSTILNGAFGPDVTNMKVIVPVNPTIGGNTYLIKVQCATTQATFSPIIEGKLEVRA